ncbi:MAG: zeta toxin family protein [Treponema sp.]|jgi:predicted kinase|nr:zeta toxin family protein [Treponema sp.]
MKLVLLLKARNTAHLVRQQKQVTRNGKTFMQAVWVNPNKERHNGERKTQTENTQEKRGNHFIPPQKFKAGDWAKQFVDPQATPDDAGSDHVLKSFGSGSEAELKKRINDAIAKNKALTPTYKWYRITEEGGKNARYNSGREELHDKIKEKLLSPAKIRTAKPEDGNKPTMIMLGGRGGSGKSWFKNNLYDPNKFVILDADSVKEKLPEYECWNANQLHEESSDILEQMIDFCKENGLNVVIDMTMKTPKSAYERLTLFKDKGYRTEAHYMHLPPQEAAKRAIKRYRDGDDKPGQYKGRFVPPEVILSMRQNEETFDQIKGLVDNWSFRDSTEGFPPKLISQKSGKRA